MFLLTTYKNKYINAISGVRLLFIPPHIGRLSQEEHLDKLLPRPRSNGILKALEVIILRGAYRRLRTYSDIVRKGTNIGIADLISREEETGPQDVCVLHFTSGTTGKPKVAMLTHQ